MEGGEGKGDEKNEGKMKGGEVKIGRKEKGRGEGDPLDLLICSPLSPGKISFLCH